MDNIWKKIDYKLRICIIVFLCGLLVTPFGILLYGINELLGFYFGFLGLAATIIGVVSMLIYWASWAD
jgi:hypothetical protein